MKKAILFIFLLTACYSYTRNIQAQSNERTPSPLPLSRKLSQQIMNDEGLTPQQKQLILDENFSNNYDLFLNFDPNYKIKFPLKSLLIPLEYLNIQKMERNFTQEQNEILQSLQEVREGKTFFKWPINPDDGLYYKKLMAHLQQQNIPVIVTSGDLQVYRTSSRSMFVKIPGGKMFSLKVSTDHVGMRAAREKIVQRDWAFDSVKLSDYIQKYKPKENSPFSYSSKVILQHEPLAVGLNSHLRNPHESEPSFFDKPQAMIARELGPMKENYTYLPAFAIFNEERGQEIAKLNGATTSEEMAEFWRIHYMEPLAKAHLTLLLYHGLNMTSNHNQQFLLELDEKQRPTGRIVIRDFFDSHFIKGLLCTEQSSEISKIFSAKDIVDSGELMVSLGVFSFGKRPSWITEVDQLKWIETFFRVWEEELKNATEIPNKYIKTDHIHHDFSKWGYKTYNIGPWKKNWQIYYCRLGLISSCNGIKCDDLLREREYEEMNQESCSGCCFQ